MSDKWLLAFGLACPTCAGGFIFAIAAIFGVGAALVKSSLAAVAVVLLVFLWIRNARRRDCPLPD